MARLDRRVVLTHPAWALNLAACPGLPDAPTEAEALLELMARGRSCLHKSFWGVVDHAVEVLYVTWAGSVLRGRSPHHTLNYDRRLASPVHRVLWCGEPVALMELERPWPLAEQALAWAQAPDEPHHRWLLARYEQALADTAVVKTRAGRVDAPDGRRLSLVDHLTETFGPP